MICDNCRVGGNYSQAANEGGPGERVLREAAVEWHELCSDIDCTCQHVTGRVLRQEAYAPAFSPDFGSSDQ